MAQSVERRIGSAEVTGPIPVGSFAPNPGKIKGLELFCILKFSFYSSIINALLNVDVKISPKKMWKHQFKIVLKLLMSTDSVLGVQLSSINHTNLIIVALDFFNI